jgi:hypothetical protein
MLADCRAADRKPGGQFTRTARRVGQSAENLAASRVAERGDGFVQRHRENICNRLVTLLSIAGLFEGRRNSCAARSSAGGELYLPNLNNH